MQREGGSSACHWLIVELAAQIWQAVAMSCRTRWRWMAARRGTGQSPQAETAGGAAAVRDRWARVPPLRPSSLSR